MTSTCQADLSLTYEAMIQAAVAAPSPDNNQPWLFRVTAEGLQVFLDHSRSLPSDVASMFDLTALGAAVENAVIAAAEQGQTAEVQWSGEQGLTPGVDHPIAIIKLRAGGTRDALFSAITKRCTNRKMYASQPLEPSVLQEVQAACACFPEVQVDWLVTRSEKQQFGKLIAMTDLLRFQHRPFHEELFRQLRFRPSEAEATADGLDVRTLELPPGVGSALHILRNWNTMQLIHNLRLTSLLTIPAKISVQRSGAIVVLSVPTSSAENFLMGGRAIQRLWLAGAAMGLAMHPMGSLPIFLLQDNPKPAFRATIEKARKGVSSLLPSVAGRVIQLALRVGTSAPPSQRSLRRPADQVILEPQ